MLRLYQLMYATQKIQQQAAYTIGLEQATQQTSKHTMQAPRQTTSAVLEKTGSMPEDKLPRQSRRLLFSAILDSPALAPDEKTSRRMAQEGAVVIGAGGETTARVLETATFYLLTDSQRLLPALRQELQEVMPDQHARPSLQKLETLTLLVSTLFCFMMPQMYDLIART